MKESRLQKQLKLREVAVSTGIDQALISKFESGGRLPTEDQLLTFAGVYSLDAKEVRTAWLAEKILGIIQYEPGAAEVLAIAESRIGRLRSDRSPGMPSLPLELLLKLEAIDALKAEWQQRKPSDFARLENIRRPFHLEFTFDSNRIEGNVLTLEETGLVVNEGLTISGASLREHLEALNHAEAVDLITGWANRQEDLSKRTLLQLHALILRNTDRENAGKFRNVPVKISNSKHEPPPPDVLDKLMDGLFIHYLQQKNFLHPVVMAADMHVRLSGIHPFNDGNGQVARLVMNFVLLGNGYTVANLKGDDASRSAYFLALERALVDKEPEAFYHLIADTLEASLQAHLSKV